MKNSVARIRQKGIGSMFEHPGTSLKNNIPPKIISLPKNNHLFYTGRHALKFVIDSIAKKQNPGTIWLPEYYCQHVTGWMKRNYNNIKVYKTDPKNKVFLNTGFTKKNDILIINNFWGVYTAKLQHDTSSLTVIEDHSHGWLSPHCLNSSADYCIASLRKSVPVPLGGIAWRPDGQKMDDLKAVENSLFSELWEMILEAQHLKSRYINAHEPLKEEKQKFLELVSRAETLMNGNHDLFKLEEAHKGLIKKYAAVNYLSYKVENLSYLKSLLNVNNSFKLVAPHDTSFGLTLFVKSEKEMLTLRTYLVGHDIYPSLLWPDNNPTYGYYLNIHLDYRYGSDEMEYIAEKLNTF